MKSSPGGSQRAKASVPSALCRMDLLLLLLLRDARFPGLDILLGGSAVGGSGWQRRAGMELCPWAQGWAHRAGSAQEGVGNEAGTECPRTRSCILVMAKGEGTQGRARSCSCTEWAAWVRASPQTVNSSKANKKKQGFRGTERIHGFGSNSAKYF